jgi:ubiquinone/menaquinone biosynthesis C-methylase UbiE
MSPEAGLYGPEQSRFAHFLEQRELRRPDPVARELRRRLLSGISGRVIEAGAGDGRSFEHYPPAVTGLVAVEPDSSARASAAERARAAPVPVRIVAGSAEALPVEAQRFDAAVVMGLLCSVTDPDLALRELTRVVRPGGELRFWEHVRSKNGAFRAFQGALDALFWTRALGGCRTTRDTESAIRRAGFEIVELERGFHSSSLVTITSAPYLLGRALVTHS